MRRLIIFSLLIFFFLQGFTQNDWQKRGVNGIPSVCYGSGKSSPSYIQAPQQYLNRLKSSKGLKSNIIVDYVGFTAEAKAAFQKAVDIWESLVYSPVPIYMVAYWSSLDEGVLGSCGPTIYYENFEAAAYKDCYYPVALVEKMQGEEITGPELPDLIAQFNKDNTSWYFGTDGKVPAKKYDFVTIVLHEIGHGLGFTGFFYDENGLGAYGDGLEYPGVFDQLVANRQNELLLDTSLFKNHSLELYSELTDNILLSLSPTAKKLSTNDAYPRIWAPDPSDEGSSIYHLHEYLYNAGDTNSLMTPYVAFGEAVHNPGPLTMGIFADMGWSFISIKHHELKDVEFPVNPITIEASVFSDEVLDSTTVKMVYTRSDFKEDSTVLSLSYDRGKDVFSVPFDDLEGGRIKYYLEASDIDGRTYRMPGIAPQKYFDFNLGPDTIRPVILHTPVKSILESSLEAEIVAQVNDNIGITMVELEYSVNSGNKKLVGLIKEADDTYSKVVAFSGLSDGDSISYRIKATDSSSNSNVSYLPANGNYVIYIDGTYDPVDDYFNNFNTFTRDFIVDQFYVGTELGFDDGALNSPHPYPSPDQDETTFEYTAMLKYPIRIKNGGVMTFKEVVLVEPGEPNTVFGDDEFWDYVIVEGSKDGFSNWHPLIPGYDSRENESWLQMYNGSIVGNNSNALGDKNLFVQKRFHLDDNNFFQVGETIFVRFRLYSDPYAHGWGWAIDDLSIQDPLTSSASLDYSPGEIVVYPNPLSNVLSIHADFRTQLSEISIKLINSTGSELIHKSIAVNGNTFDQSYDIHFLTPGVYLLVVGFENGQTITRKLIKQ